MNLFLLIMFLFNALIIKHQETKDQLDLKNLGKQKLKT